MADWALNTPLYLFLCLLRQAIQRPTWNKDFTLATALAWLSEFDQTGFELGAKRNQDAISQVYLLSLAFTVVWVCLTILCGWRLKG